MKRIFTILTLILASTLLFAQAPTKISFQAIIRDANNQLLNNQEVGIQISILAGSDDGEEVYTETQSAETNKYGVISIEIGDGEVLKGEITNIDWTEGSYFIITKIDPTQPGGTSYSIVGTSQLVSVPFALHAKTAESLTGEAYESDPEFSAWDKSTGIFITKSQIIDFGNFLEAETDPVFTSWNKSEGIVVTESQISDLGDYIEAETDPEFHAWDKSSGVTISESQIADFGNYTESETDPEFSQSAASEILSAGSGEVITTAERSKLVGIEEGAEKNVKSDWNAASGDAQIINKPSNLSDFNNDAGFIALTENPSSGDMFYFDGTSWVRLPKGSQGQLLAVNANGEIVWGNAPQVTTTEPVNPFNENAILTGIVNASGLETTVTFEYGTTADYGNSIEAVQNPIVGSDDIEVTASISGLTVGETYHYRVKAQNVLTTIYGHDISFTVTLLSIGDEFGGGKVAYIFQPGDNGYVEGETHGIIASTSNITSPSHSIWGCSGTAIGTSTAIGSGKENTLAIVSSCPASSSSQKIAAHVCNNLNRNGYSDWFLPSQDELTQIYLNKEIFGITSDDYWTSSEVNSVHAKYRNFATGTSAIAGKGILFRVRPVRYF